MFIYVVKTGDSLFSIATKYQVSMDSIRLMNGLTTDRLVPGQDLLIPTDMYIVQPGDSLYSISQMSLTPIETIRLYNSLQSDFLMVGMRLYLPPRPKYELEGFSYITPSTPERNQMIVQTFAPINTYFGIFEYHVLEDGSLSTLNDQQLIRLSRENKVAPLAVITNLTPTGFSPELTRRVLSSPEIRERLINNIYNLVKTKNYAGVNIDFERIREGERDLYSGFLRSISERLRPEGYYTSVAVPAKTSDDIPWLKGYDYGGIGAAVDFVFIMAYDWHEASSPPGPVAPIREVRQTIEYALNHMRGNKIILGVPRYGYDWTMSDGTVDSARAVSVSRAIETAMKFQVPIQYSTEYQQPFFQYRDETGKRHIVWFEDARARAHKFQLVVNYRLRGVGAWQLGLHFPQSAILVREFFTTKKII
ncbi:glycosyl hydrolase family 18 protein [Metabacillus sediminilitoris]|uniref:LysM peptidoglycan-binding domain-containing protein n=1 Tax=Metabacillus sediminilitoris TaxID=2567941 RepID=A0A4S4BX19_9BACI|nr:glycosyl hydrolase family 18 protein [Metabacillus sediminilitoris]QGQ46073.1 LysM peptidoglycan-binding domain-containing protein [Metabacillus sediminilitoris]THF79757.1 LysM peptidoglycan-binding domain-containing protein [Metabacillus sediminilitoris]